MNCYSIIVVLRSLVPKRMTFLLKDIKIEKPSRRTFENG